MNLKLVNKSFVFVRGKGGVDNFRVTLGPVDNQEDARVLFHGLCFPTAEGHEFFVEEKKLSFTN